MSGEGNPGSESPGCQTFWKNVRARQEICFETRLEALALVHSDGTVDVIISHFCCHWDIQVVGLRAHRTTILALDVN